MPYNHAEHLADRARMMQQWADMPDRWQKGDDKATPIKHQAAAWMKSYNEERAHDLAVVAGAVVSPAQCPRAQCVDPSEFARSRCGWLCCGYGRD